MTARILHLFARLLNYPLEIHELQGLDRLHVFLMLMPRCRAALRESPYLTTQPAGTRRRPHDSDAFFTYAVG